MFEMHHRTEMEERTGMASSQASLTRKQTFRLLIALSLLLVALTVVLVKDREFWFGSDQAVQSDAGSQSVAKIESTPAPAKRVEAPPAPAATVKSRKVAKTATHPAITEPSQQPAVAPASPVVATSNRVVLPPLDVEVVAGDSHRTVHPGSNAAKVEILGDSNRASTVTASMPSNAAERERLIPATVPELRQALDSTYPLLGRHMKVQGSVVLQAIISADGVIENLTVISGPAILATAAQQAVRQWRFKPYLENGQPVETKTRITVNFSIRVADNPTTSS
jgi:protein TonB